MAPSTKSKAQKPDEDISQLRKPITLHGKPVEQILNSIHYGSPELRDLLLYECDMIFECKVCRALFRDLPNFISHKRRYCTTSVADMNHFTIGESPEERVIMIQPQPVDESEIAKTKASSVSAQPGLEDTLQRIRSGDVGNSHAFQVFTNAAAKLRHQKDHARITSLRPREIPTNSNAVFVDVTSTSVNIHDRAKCADNNDQMRSDSPSMHQFSNKRKTGMSKKRINVASSTSAEKQLRSRTSTNNNKPSHKKSDELTDRLIKELKVIQNKVKNKTLENRELKQKSCSEEQRLDLVKENSFQNPLKNKHIVHDEENFRVKQHSSFTSCKEDKFLNIKEQNLTNGLIKNKKTATELDADETSSSFSHNEEDATSCSSKEGDGKSKQSLICPKCGGIFSSRKSLQYHVKTNHSVKRMFYPCPYCSNLYYYFNTITRHLKTHHDKTKKDIDEMRPMLRSKAFSKPYPSQDTKRVVDVSIKGSQRSSRYKNSSTRKMGNTSYVYSSIMKGKKLSAKKDLLLFQKSLRPKKSSKELVVNETLKVSESEADKTKHVMPDKHFQQQDVSEKPISFTNSRTSENNQSTASMSAKPFNDMVRQIQTCAKCLRLFGRKATYDKHIETCGITTITEENGVEIGCKKTNSKSTNLESTPISTRGKVKDKELLPFSSGHKVSSDSNHAYNTSILQEQHIEADNLSSKTTINDINESKNVVGENWKENGQLFVAHHKSSNSESCSSDNKEFSASVLQGEPSEKITRLKSKSNADPIEDTFNLSVEHNLKLPLSINVNRDVNKKLLIQDRPKRKRKVPSKNIEAVDLLQKIHRTDENESSLERKAKYSEIVKDSPTSRSVKRQEESCHVLRPKKRSSKIFISNKNKLECYNLLKVEKFMDIKKLKCRKCNSIFRSKATLKAHVVRSHFGWSRFQCKLCGFSCFHRSECKNHIRRSHFKTREDKNNSPLKFIIDLSKKGSEAMILKKHQTLKAKTQQQQTTGDNIYKNQNAQKHPRLPDRKAENIKKSTNSASNISPRKQQNENKQDVSSCSSDHNKSSPSSSTDSHSDRERMLQSRRVLQVSHLVPRKPRLQISTHPVSNKTPPSCSFNGQFDHGKSIDTPSISTSISLKSDDEDMSIKREILAPNNNLSTVSNNTSLKKVSMPFNISTRKSPRVFDISPYNREDIKAEITEEGLSTLPPPVNRERRSEVIMNTRHGTYTKIVPTIPQPYIKDSTKSSLDSKQKKDDVSFNEKEHDVYPSDPEEEIISMEECSDSDDDSNSKLKDALLSDHDSVKDKLNASI